MGSTHIEQLQKELRRSKGGIGGYITFLEKTISTMKGIEEYQSFLRSEIEAGRHQEPPRTGEAVRWQAPMKRFLNAFQNIDWEAIRHQSGLLDWYELIIGLLMGKDTMCWLPHAHYKLHEESDMGTYTDITGGARKYAFHTLSYRTDTLLACRIQNFQRFIFVSYCAVLIDLEAKHDEVHDIMRICVSDTSSKNLDRYISGARLINKWMDILLRRGWGFRSWEVFLFCQSTYVQIQFPDLTLEQVDIPWQSTVPFPITDRKQQKPLKNTWNIPERNCQISRTPIVYLYVSLSLSTT
jgi:hypothetical protein